MQANETETAWGRWVRDQPRGVMMRAMRVTGLAYSTIHDARYRLMSRDVAEKLAAFSAGGVHVRDIVKPRAPVPGASL